MDTTTALTTLVAGSRVAIGLGLLAAPEQVGGSWLGRTASQAPTKVAVRGLGARDLALGLAQLGALRATGSSGTGLAVLTGLAAACDTVDALTTAAAGDELPGGGTTSVAVASAGALLGVISLLSRPRA